MREVVPSSFSSVRARCGCAVIFFRSVITDVRLCVRCAVFSIGVVVVLLMNDYKDIQSKFKQYIDYNQLFDLVIKDSSSSPLYYVEKVRWALVCQCTFKLRLSDELCVAAAFKLSRCRRREL